MQALARDSWESPFVKIRAGRETRRRPTHDREQCQDKTNVEKSDIAKESHKAVLSWRAFKQLWMLREEERHLLKSR